MLPYAATLLLLATAVCAQTQRNYNKIDLGDIPTPQEILVVVFEGPQGRQVVLNYGNVFKKSTLNHQPRILYFTKDNDYYAVAGLMLAGADDPQCPGKQTLLSLQININGSKTDTTGDEVSPYEVPRVTKKSAILYLAVRQNGIMEKDAVSELLDGIDDVVDSRECYSFVDDFMEPNGITQVYAGCYGFVTPN